MDEQTRNRSLKYSFADGVFAAAMLGFVQDYLTPFLLVIGGSMMQVGLLTALPNFIAAASQLKIAEITDFFKSRKKTIVAFVVLQAMVCLAAFLLAFFFVRKPFLLITLAVLFVTFGAISTPAWGSLMADTVEEKKRGAYFGWRNMVLGLVMIGVSFVSGVILYFSKNINIFYGFSVIFFGAFAARMISAWFLSKMHEPPYSSDESNCFTFGEFIGRTRESNFAKFTIYIALVSFSVQFSGPFFAVLMLRDMSFSYVLYSAVTVASTLTMYLCMKTWGAHSDKVGNLKIIRVCAKLIAVIPLLWLVSLNPFYLFLVQIFSGFVWAGFNLCSSNFIYDAVSSPKRTRCIAYFNFINGIGICLGALLGGLALPYLPKLLGHNIFSLFVISSVLRLVVGFYVVKLIREVREVRQVSSKELMLSILGIKPVI